MDDYWRRLDRSTLKPGFIARAGRRSARHWMAMTTAAAILYGQKDWDFIDSEFSKLVEWYVDCLLDLLGESVTKLPDHAVPVSRASPEKWRPDIGRAGQDWSGDG